MNFLSEYLQTAEGICLKNVNLQDLKICIDTSLRERVSQNIQFHRTAKYGIGAPEMITAKIFWHI